MQPKAQDDDRLMTLVEIALARPSGERERYLRDACGADSDLFDEAWDYVQWEERMNQFLLDPLIPPAPEERPFEPGEVLDGRFRILREIAQGGMGIVYEAEDEKLDRRVALKCAKAGFGHRLPPEVRNATEISHPNVCKIFEIHTAARAQGDVDFVTMEFLDGETLAARLARGPLPRDEARRVAMQLCAGLAEAHRNRVVHGDLKSNNVILAAAADGPSRAVITDFGLARRPGAGRAAPSAPVGGTPDYMAPELWKGEKATAASDIYALGVLLRQLSPGDRRWTHVVDRCLDPDPARRFRTADDVARALAPISRRVILGAAAAVVLAAASAFVAYERATAPRESIALAMRPLDAAADAAPLAAQLSRDTAAQLARIRGGKRARFKVASSAGSASHILRGNLRRDEGKLVLHVYVTDTHTGADIGDHEFTYLPAELRYAPVAMSAVVTNALHLPHPPSPPVNDAARQDYQSGFAFTRRNSTIDRALPLLQRAVEADPDSPLTWAALAEGQWIKFFVTQDRAILEAVQESVRQAQNRDLDLAPVHRVAGLLRNNGGSYEQAQAEYLRAIELDPDGDAYRRLGAAYQRAGKSDQALTAYQKAAQLDPGYFKAHQALGSYYLEHENRAEAIAELQKCAALAPDEPDVRYALGTVFYNEGRYAEAEQELRAALALGETPRAFNNLAMALMRQGKDRDSIDVLVRGLDRYPDRWLWWLNLGDMHRRTGAPENARVAYRRSLDLLEKEIAGDLRKSEVRAHLAYVCARLGERDRALSEIRQALQVLPGTTDTRLTAVWTYEALSRREDSIQLLKDSTDEVLKGTLRLGDLADLRQDSRFQQLITSRGIQ